MAYQAIMVSEDDNIRTITLNRPDNLNAINERITSELREELEAISRNRALRCLVLTGAGRAFSAGQDLKEISARQEPVDYTRELHRRYHPIVTGLRSLEIPVIASINGAAAGAGWSLALACDLRIASTRATFLSAFGKIGLVPDAGMTWLLPRLVGLAKALEITWLGDPISAHDALALGLVNRLAEPDQLAAVTRETAARLTRAAPRSLALSKQAMYASLANGFEAQLEYEARSQGIAGRTKDYARGVRSFMNKQPPEFIGE